MIECRTDLDRAIHKKLAIDLFNFTWELIEKPDCSEAENDLMINAAHACRFHRGLAGTPLHFARSAWQLSRVYALVPRGGTGPVPRPEVVGLERGEPSG